MRTKLTIDQIKNLQGLIDSNYKADAVKLKSYWRAVYGATSAQAQGSWGVLTSGAGVYYSNNTIFTKYNKWSAYDTYNITTGATAGSRNSIYGANTGGNRFKRWGNGTYSAIVFKIGVPIQAAATYGSANTLCFCGISTENSGTPLTSADYTFSSLASNALCVGWRPTDLNLQIIYRNNVGTLLFIDLGSNFPVPNEIVLNIKSAYEIIFFDPNSSTDVQITVNRIDMPYTFTTTIQPALATVSTIYYAPCVYITTNEAVQKGLGVSSIECYQWVA